MNINVNVTVDGQDGIDLTTEVQTVRRYDGELDDYVETPVTLGEIVARRISADLTKDDSYPGLRKRFLELRDEEIREQVKPLVTEALTGPIQKTNTYGEPTGQTTSMRELVMAEAKKIVSKPTDSYGRGETFLQKLVREEISRAFIGELNKVMAAEKEKVVVAVRAKAAELIAEAVKQGVGR